MTNKKATLLIYIAFLMGFVSNVVIEKIGEPEMSKEYSCPNCRRPLQLVQGNKYLCENCDKVFLISEKGAQVKELSPLADLRSRVEKLESQVGQKQDLNQDQPPAADQDQPEQNPDENQEPEQDDEDFY